jgi:hypothetical protein
MYTEKTKAKENHLSKLGFTNIETIAVQGYDTEYQFQDDGQPCSILDNDFEIEDTASDILNASDFYSCCGDILDKDLMICPTCKEHC